MESDRRTLFLLFYKVLNFYEGCYSGEGIEVLFRIAKIVEDTCSKLQNIGAYGDFEDKLKEFWKIKGLKLVPLQFFKKSSYHLLSRCITDSKFSDSDVSVAVQQFILNRSEREFFELCRELASTQRSVALLKETFYSPENFDQHKAEQCVEELKRVLIKSRGDVEVIHSEVIQNISQDSRNFKTFLKVLCLSDDCEIVLNVQEVVALSINKLLADCDNVNLYSDIVELEEEDFGVLVSKWEYFIETFLQTIRYAVERLRCDYSGNSYTWINAGSETCLSYENIISLLHKCKTSPGINDQIKEFLQKLREEEFWMIAEDLKRSCRIK